MRDGRRYKVLGRPCSTSLLDGAPAIFRSGRPSHAVTAARRAAPRRAGLLGLGGPRGRVVGLLAGGARGIRGLTRRPGVPAAALSLPCSRNPVLFWRSSGWHLLAGHGSVGSACRAPSAGRLLPPPPPASYLPHCLLPNSDLLPSKRPHSLPAEGQGPGNHWGWAWWLCCGHQGGAAGHEGRLRGGARRAGRHVPQRGLHSLQGG